MYNYDLSLLESCETETLALLAQQLTPKTEILFIESEQKAAERRKRDCAPLNGNRCFSLLK